MFFNNIRLQNSLFFEKNIIRDLRQRILAKESNKIDFIKKLYYEDFEDNFDFAKKIRRVISLKEIYIIDNLINKTITKIIEDFVVNLSIQDRKCSYFFIIYIYLRKLFMSRFIVFV